MRCFAQVRNLRGHRFAPACDAMERRAIEGALVKALAECAAGNKIFEARYYPLHGSMSYAANLGGNSLSTYLPTSSVSASHAISVAQGLRPT